MISVVIPVFNRIDILKDTLDSIARQTYPEIEVIVVDDGSRPPVELQEFEASGSPFKKLIRQENQGAPAARNRGFDESRGEYVIFWDADIMAEPDMLKKMSAALAVPPEAAYAYCAYSFGRHRMPAGPFAADRLRRQNYIAVTALIRREAFPRYDQAIRRFQDWDLWLTMLEAGNTGVYVPGYLYRAVPHRSGISTWLPAMAYRAPWRWLPGWRGRVREYERAREIIIRKHGLA